MAEITIGVNVLLSRMPCS